MPVIAIILLVVSVVCAGLTVSVRYVHRTEILGFVVRSTDVFHTVCYKLGFGLAAALCLWGAGVLSGWWVL